MNDGFVFFASFYEAIKELAPEDQLAVYDAICRYGLMGEEPECGGIVKAVFKLVKPNMDANMKKREAGRRGGEAKTKQSGSTTEADAKQSGSKEEANTKQTGSKTEKVPTEGEGEVEGEVEVEVEVEKRESPSNEGRKRERFVPPTLEEVQDYCEEKHLGVDPIVFFQYFTEGHWMDSKGQKVRNWKQKILTWNSHGNGTRAQPENKLDQKLREIASWR